MNTNNNEAEIKDAILWREVMRLVALSRDNGLENLLDAALEGREKSPASVSKLYSFVRKYIGEGTAADKYWRSCSTFLSASGWTTEQLNELRNPSPQPGQPGFRSILDEMHDEGRD